MLEEVPDQAERPMVRASDRARIRSCDLGQRLRCKMHFEEIKTSEQKPVVCRRQIISGS